VLLRWLEETAPDLVCLQELKNPDEKFPLAAIKAAGYGAVWPAILTTCTAAISRRR
jgi:exodeoxyribonuclease-3